MNIKFIPFSEISLYEDVIVVDSFHPDALNLSQWRNVPPHKEIEDDTTTGIVLNALEKGYPRLENYQYVTNNHFDIDGFLAIWSLHFPEKALQYNSLFRKMAIISNLRELKLQTEEDQFALQLVCWINKIEQALFYPPFASSEEGKNEIKLCVGKYKFFLTQFEKVLNNPEEYRHHWQMEYNQVLDDLQKLQGKESRITLVENIRLLIVETTEPLHYFALFGRSEPADMVLTIYKDNRYELEYKYSTWVNCATRTCFPRIDMQPLAHILNLHEETQRTWISDKITDSGPILRLDGENLTKEQRYDHPTNRTIHSSSIPPDELKSIVISFYEKAYANVQRKKSWTWPEIRKINRELTLH